MPNDKPDATGDLSSLDAHVAQHQLDARLVVELRGDVETLGLGKRVARYFTSSTVRLNDGSGCQPKNRPTYFYPCRFHLSDSLEYIFVLFTCQLSHVAQHSGHFGQGQNGQNRFRERGHCSLYININIYIIVADFDSLFSILTKMTMTTLTATRPRFFYGLKGPIGLAAKAALAPSLSL